MPVTIGAKGSANTQTTSPATDSQANVELLMPGLGIVTATAKGGRPFGADPASFDFVKTVNVATGIVLNVGLSVSAFASACPVCASPADAVTSSASLDPYFMTPPGYTILLSPRIGNPSRVLPPPAIPETTTWICCSLVSPASRYSAAVYLHAPQTRMRARPRSFGQQRPETTRIAMLSQQLFLTLEMENGAPAKLFGEPQRPPPWCLRGRGMASDLTVVN